MEKKIKLLHIALIAGAAPNFPIENAFRNNESIDEYKKVDWVSIKNNLGLVGFQSELINIVKIYKPTIIFMQIQREGIISPEMGKIMSENAFVINWTGDVRSDISWYIKLGKEIDLTLFTNETDVEKCIKEGVNSAYLQVSCDTQMYNTSKPKKYYGDIVFLANEYTNSRLEFPLSKFRKNAAFALKEEFGNKFQVYGNGWDKYGIYNKTLSPTEEVQAYRAAKIALNISHFNYKKYSSDRLFRIMFSGAFVLSHNYLDIEKEFIPNKHLGVFANNNIHSLIDSCKFWLANDSRRNAIAEQGRLLVNSRDT